MNDLVFQLRRFKQPDKILNYLPIIIVLWMAMRIIWFLPSYDNGFYLFLATAFILIVIKGIREKIKINPFGIGLIFICALSILFNDIPDIFRPWQRFLLWIIVVVLVGPFIKLKTLCDFRIILLIYIQILNFAIVIISFIGKFIGISKTQSIFFTGIASHSILFGIISANSFILLIYIIINYYGQINKLKKCLLWIFLVVNILMLLASSSRSAMISAILGITPLIFIFFKRNFSKSLLIISLLFLFLLIISPIFEDYTIGLKTKNNGQTMSLDISSREENWNEAIRLFKNNPILGAGFSMFFINDDNEIAQKGRIETGNSWLGVLSMTGILGFAFMMILIFQSGLQIYNLFKNNNKYIDLFCSMIICYILHMCGEGYIFAGGSVLCLNFWLILGVISAYNDYANEKVK